MGNSYGHLGKHVNYSTSYNPDLLVRIPRSENREEHNISCDIVGIGFDIWHLWEFSFLTNNGYPVTGVLKLLYPSRSKYIVESKSLKLYLNSFNMSRYGSNSENGVIDVVSIIENDLSALLESKVTVSYFNELSGTGNDFSEYLNLDKLIDKDTIEFSTYNESPELLKEDFNSTKEIMVYSDSLRSNCRVTHQPDWATVFIYMDGSNAVDKSSLLQYIVSFRNENHFHEEVCELIYKRLFDRFSPDKLMVCCIYTRRGGIDISPVRASHSDLLPKFHIKTDFLCDKLYRQ